MVGAPGPGGGGEAPPALRPYPALRPGDRVALFSPSAHAGRQPPELIDRALETLRGWGLQPLPAPEPARHLYLAGTDAWRAEAFQRLYCDPEVKALLATRGGYGAARMLPLLDARAIAAAPPKAVVGMSDVAALLAYLQRVAGVVTLHGPCLGAPAAYETPHADANQEALRRLLFEPQAALHLPCRVLHWPAGEDDAPTGRLTGGCLSVLAAAAGTPWAPETRGAVLFLEDVGEAPYRVDRYLTQLRQAGLLDAVRAVVLGYMQGCDGEPPGLLTRVLEDLFAGAPYPVLTGLSAGHGAENHTLPLGRLARLHRRGEGAAELVLA